MESRKWTSTVHALDELGKTLICSVCSQLLKEPCSLGVCDHLFCKYCIINHLENSCPECDSPAWVKDLLPSRELTVVVQMYQRLQRLVKLCPTSVQGITDTENSIDDLHDSELESDSKSPLEHSEIEELEKCLDTCRTDLQAREMDSEMSTDQDTCEDKSTTSENDVEEVKQKTNRRKGAKYIPPWRKNTSKKTKRNIPRRPRCPRDTAFLKENLGKQKKQISSFLTTTVLTSDSTPDDYCPPFKKHSMSAEMRKKRIDSCNAEWDKIPLQDLKSNKGRRIKKRFMKRKVSFSCLEDELNLINKSVDSQSKGDDDRLILNASCSEMTVEMSESNETVDKFDSVPNCIDGDNTSPRKTSPTQQKHSDVRMRKVDESVTKSDMGLRHKSERTANVKEKKTCNEQPHGPTSDMWQGETNPTVENSEPREVNGGDHLQKISPIFEKRDASKRKRSSQEGDQTHCERMSSLQEKGNKQTTPKDEPRSRLSLEKSTLNGKNKSEDKKMKTISSLYRSVSSKAKKQSSLDQDRPSNTRKRSSLEGQSGKKSMAVDYLKRNKKGETPLHLASIKGDIQNVEMLLQQGADANVRDYAGWRPLHEAANHGHADVVSLLLDHGALIDAPGFENDSPLHDALANNRINVVKVLVKNGANIMARNMFGLTPTGMAITKAMKNALKTKVLQETERAGHSVEKAVTNTVAKTNEFVFICTGLNNEQKNTMEACARMLDAEISKTFTDDVTHVIASCAGGVCLRTLKYLQGVISAKWIVSFEWIERCVHEKQAVDEGLYEVAGTMSSPSSPGPMRARLNAAAQYPPLFDGCHFFFHGSFTAPSKKDLGELVKCGGGTLLLREPKMDDDIVQSSRRIAYHSSLDSQQPNCCYYIINSPLHDAMLVNTAKLCSVPLSWLMDCIAQFKILSTDGY
ncbi:BRCA1-associated RING domain protein 1-like [Antedon mediterranea]|uniref:BRCA1-associated RING domain protein 1-like n=1 Tax=Antedon mediterranea TaxID=105859 RepID=UPI003AF5CEF0